MGSSSSKDSAPPSEASSPYATSTQDAEAPPRRHPRRKESLGGLPAQGKSSAAAPTATLGIATGESAKSHSRSRSRTIPTPQLRPTDASAGMGNTQSSEAKGGGDGSTTPNRSRSPRPPLNVDTSTPDSADLQDVTRTSSNKSTAASSTSPTPYFLPASNFGRPPRLPLPIEEEELAPPSPAPGSPTIRPADFAGPGEGVEEHEALPQSKSVLSSTTLDEDEDLDDAMYREDEMKGPLVDTLLEWKEGGEKVYVTGTFCDWNKKSRLHKHGPSNDPEAFSAIIALPPGTHYLAFLVDGASRTARHMPTTVEWANSLVNYIQIPPEDLADQPVKVKDQSPHPQSQHQSQPKKDRQGQSISPSVDSRGSQPPAGSASARVQTSEVRSPLTHSQQPAATATISTPLKKPATPQTAGATTRRQDHKKYHSEIPRFLLDWDAPEGSSRMQRASAVMATQPVPPSLPMFLTKSVLTSATPLKDDASVLVLPNHTVLNHLATSSIKDGVLATSATTRYYKKYVTTIMYRPTSDSSE